MASNSPPAAGEHDWTESVADRIESLVTKTRDRTTVPATLAARGVVYGIVAGVLASALLVLLVIGVVRVLDVYLPFHPLGRRVWAVDAGASAIFLAVGTFLWRKRRAKGA
jgi:hypothetical protein